MREEILRLIEKNSRIDIHEMAILLGAKEAEVANAIADITHLLIGIKLTMKK